MWIYVRILWSKVHGCSTREFDLKQTCGDTPCESSTDNLKTLKHTSYRPAELEGCNAYQAATLLFQPHLDSVAKFPFWVYWCTVGALSRCFPCCTYGLGASCNSNSLCFVGTRNTAIWWRKTLLFCGRNAAILCYLGEKNTAILRKKRCYFGEEKTVILGRKTPPFSGGNAAIFRRKRCYFGEKHRYFGEETLLFWGRKHCYFDQKNTVISGRNKTILGKSSPLLGGRNHLCVG